MRRKDREITDMAEIESIIQGADVCRIGLSQDNIPYIVPMNYGYREGCLYLHSSREGRKLDFIRSNNIVCFEVDIGYETVSSDKACSWTARYMSVIGSGKAYIVDNREEKVKALDIIMDHYDRGVKYEYPGEIVDRVAIIKIEIQEMTGKKSGY